VSRFAVCLTHCFLASAAADSVSATGSHRWAKEKELRILRCEVSVSQCGNKISAIRLCAVTDVADHVHSIHFLWTSLLLTVQCCFDSVRSDITVSAWSTRRPQTSAKAA